MDLNRNQFFFLGIVILLVGVQFRAVSAFVLTPRTTQFIAERTGHASDATSQSYFNATSGTSAAPRKVVEPPEWLGWCLMSIGAVLILHSLAMKRPT